MAETIEQKKDKLVKAGMLLLAVRLAKGEDVVVATEKAFRDVVNSIFEAIGQFSQAVADGTVDQWAAPYRDGGE